MARKALKYTLEDSSKEKNKNKKAFVDRVVPIQCFERELNELREDHDAFSVLYYWGVGGIGKTHLMEHLLREADHSSDSTMLIDTMPALLGEDQLRVKYSLDISTNEVEVLYRLRTKLKEEYKKRCDKDFDFLLFDIAVAAYEEKSDEEHRIGEKSSSRSSILEDLKSMGEVAGISIPFYDVYEKVKKGYSATKNIMSRYAEGKVLNQYAEYITSLNNSSSEQLLKRLHRGFSYDLVRMIESLQKSFPESLPVVIAIDTLERLDYKTTENINNPEYDDSWLFGRPDTDGQYVGGLIESVPSVLWLLCGRDQIDDRKLSSEYQIRIDKLAESDVKELLEIRDVNVSDEIAAAICEVTEGVPVYVDICIDMCIEKDENVTKKDFEGGITQIVNRYLQLMSDQDKLNLYLMSSLGQWTDDDFKAISDRLSDFRSLEISYNKLMRKSFIYTDDGVRRIFHNIVREAIFADRDYSPGSKKENLKAITGYYKEQLNRKEISNERVLFLTDRIIFLCQEIISGRDEFEYIRPLFDLCSRALKTVNIHKDLELKLAVYNNADQYGLSNREKSSVELVLSASYSLNGNEQEALKLKEHAVNNLISEYGEKDHVAIRGLNDLANSHYTLGHYEEALKIRERLYETCKEVFGDDDDLTHIVLFNLSNSLSRAGKKEEALRILEELYDIRKKRFGEDHPDTLMTLNNIGSRYSDSGQYEEARKLFEEVYQKRNVILGENHPDTLNALYNLSTACSKLGMKSEALQYAEKVYEKQKEMLGETHPETLKTLNDLSDIYAALGRNQEALEAGITVYEQRRILFGESHEFTISVLRTLPSKYTKVGRNQEALNTSKAVYENYTKTLGESHPTTLAWLNSIGPLYYLMNQIVEAKDCYQRTLAACKQKDVLTDKEEAVMSEALFWLAEINAADQKVSEAEELYNNTFQYLQKTYESDNEGFLRSYLGKCFKYLYFLNKQNKKEKSLEIYQNAIRAFRDLRLMKDRKPDNQELDTYYRAGMTAIRLGKKDEGFIWLLELVRLMEDYSVVGYEKRKANVFHLYALFFEVNGQFQDAILYHNKALDLYMELSKEDPKCLEKVDQCAERLCRLYETNGNPEEAERIRGLKDTAHAQNG